MVKKKNTIFHETYFNLKNKKNIKQNNKRITIKRLNNFFQKSIGFMFHFNKNQIMIFSFNKLINYSITNLFVFISLDLIFLDEDYRVMEIKKEFRSFSLYYKPQKKYKYLIEIPSSLSLFDKIKINSKIEI